LWPRLRHCRTPWYTPSFGPSPSKSEFQVSRQTSSRLFPFLQDLPHFLPFFMAMYPKLADPPRHRVPSLLPSRLFCSHGFRVNTRFPTSRISAAVDFHFPGRERTSLTCASISLNRPSHLPYPSPMDVPNKFALSPRFTDGGPPATTVEFPFRRPGL